MQLETIRQLARGTLGYRSATYRLAAKLLTRAEILRKEGFKTLAAVDRISAMNAGDLEMVDFRSLLYPIEVRPGTTDLATVLDTIVREEYGKYLPNGGIQSMIDAGAFIGDTSSWFLSRFPKLSVWALEPNPENYWLASRNLGRYVGRAEVLPFALSHTAGTVHFSGDATGGGIADSGIEVESVTIPKLLSRVPGHCVDVLKIDIEGAELDLFTKGSLDWLGQVKLIIIELHGVAIEEAVLEVLKVHGFNARRYRSVFYCAKQFDS